MAPTVGILLRPSDAGTATALAQRAEARGLALVVVDGGANAGADGTLDAWTLASWLAGATESIAIGVDLRAPEPAAASERPLPDVVDRARESLDLLAPGRLLLDPEAWRVVPRADAAAALAQAGAVVVVPAQTLADVDAVAAIAAELAPADGEATARPVGRRRSLAALARRRPGIDYDGVPASLADRAVEPGDPEYATASVTYLRGGAPGIVLRPRTVAEVVDAVGFARAHRDVPLGIRSGGHGISGRSTNRGGVVIDVGALNQVKVLDAAAGLVRVGPGASWKRVAAALQPYGLAITSGDYGGVGVGGLATAGGVGLLSRSQGLTIDRVRAVEMVLADGRVVSASVTENPELFWGVRGAGANLGVVTSVELEAGRVGEVGWAQLALVVDDLEEALHRFGETQSAAPRDTTMFVVVGRQGGYSVLQMYGVVADPDPDTVIARLTPFAQLGQLVQQQVVMTPYAGVLAGAGEAADGHHGFGEPVARSGMLRAITPEVAGALAQLVGSPHAQFVQVRSIGGATADVPSDATAFAHRDAAFVVSAMGRSWESLSEAWSVLTPHTSGAYLSFETGTTPEVLTSVFPEPALARLRRLKSSVDPTGLFRDNLPIPPASDEVAAGHTREGISA